jgi:hypothetical protein
VTMARRKRRSRPEAAPESWSERNQRWLTRELARLQARIDAQETGTRMPATVGPDDEERDVTAGAANTFVSALDAAAGLFGLSPFERELLLLTVGVELSADLRNSVSRMNGPHAANGPHSQPTFALALRTLTHPHWDALSPESSLRHWRLIVVEGRRSLALQPLYVDERVLHFLTGVAAIDERLLGIAEHENIAGAQVESPLARRIAAGLARRDARTALVLLTQDRSAPEALRSAVRQGLGLTKSSALWILARNLPSEPTGSAELARLVDREAALLGAVPVIELDSLAEAAVEHEERAVALVSHLRCPAVLLGSPASARLGRLEQRRITRVTLSGSDERALREQRLPHLPPGQADDFLTALQPALAQFRSPATTLGAAVEQVLIESQGTKMAPDALARQLWAACREAARGGLDAFAQRVDSKARFDDLVLPAGQIQLLREIAEHLPQRRKVYEEWGLGGKTERGQGLCALFAGESGTGKTLAAEAIANEVSLDLYRIDLASVVSKYIGETEKNLKRLFDAAEGSGAVLLFDEADALYGKRSEVKDSHDRYANIEVAYLLQRIETYRGLAILTTNLRSAIDRAFLRRIRFVVQFPFPDEAARAKIWDRELPGHLPTEELDYAALARVPLAGGHIHNVALNAAFIAAAAGKPISMAHLRHAAQREASKVERPLTESVQRAFG